MPLAFAALTVGLWLAYSGFKGLSLMEVLAGREGETLDPSSKPTATFPTANDVADTGGDFTGSTDVTTSGGGR